MSQDFFTKLHTATKTPSRKSLPLVLLLIVIINQISTQANPNYKGPTPEITVGKMNSPRTQIPFQYYYLDFCRPSADRTPLAKRDTIGELFTGDTYFETIYRVPSENSFCMPACSKKFKQTSIELFKWMIDREYTVTFYINNLPIGISTAQAKDFSKTHYKVGLKLGFKEDDKYYINNHLRFTILYNYSTNPMSKQYQIVGAKVHPMSIRSGFYVHKATKETKNCADSLSDNEFDPKEKMELLEDSEVAFTYDIIYEETDIKYSSRWDFLLFSEEDSIHWKPILLSMGITALASLWVLFVFCKSVGQDISNHNLRVIQGDIIDDKTWKQLCYDVFRPPIFRSILCAMIGTGIQLFMILTATLSFGYLGFLHPEHRGYLLNTIIILSIVMSLFSGYFSSRFYRVLNGERWLENLLVTAFLFPALLFMVVLVIFSGLYFEKSAVSLVNSLGRAW